MTDGFLDEASTRDLHELLLSTEDTGRLLDELVTTTAEALSTDTNQMSCAITLLRPKRSITVAFSDERAEVLDEVQLHSGEGPCLTAAREDRLVHIPDVRTDPRWPHYRNAAVEAGFLSVLGVPLTLEDRAMASLNVYAHRPRTFDEATLEVVRYYAVFLSTFLRLAVRMARHRDAEVDLRNALASRTEIDLAVGIIMGRRHCTQEQAVDILRTASSRRNVKMRVLAAELVQTVGQGPASTHFDT